MNSCSKDNRENVLPVYVGGHIGSLIHDNITPGTVKTSGMMDRDEIELGKKNCGLLTLQNVSILYVSSGPLDEKICRCTTKQRKEKPYDEAEIWTATWSANDTDER